MEKSIANVSIVRVYFEGISCELKQVDIIDIYGLLKIKSIQAKYIAGTNCAHRASLVLIYIIPTRREQIYGPLNYSFCDFPIRYFLILQKEIRDCLSEINMTYNT